MEQESTEGDELDLIERPKVWTFRLTSGPPFRLGLPNNPVLDYKGGLEIWKAIMTEATAKSLLHLMETMNVRVTCFCEKETSEQTIERLRRLGLASR